MCGIAIVVCGIRIDSSSCLSLNSVSPSAMTEQVSVAALQFSIEDIKSALLRRGPDRLGERRINLSVRASAPGSGQEICSVICIEEHEIRKDAFLRYNGNNFRSEEGDNCSSHLESVTEMHFFGATLQLRGMNPVSQPLTDSSGNVLAYNGEIFGGVLVNRDDNDGEVLLKSLGKCCKGEKISVPDILSEIKGPWALIYWQENTKTLWFGRDAFGRRSLLVHWPTSDDPRFLLSSVSPSSSSTHSPGSDAVNGNNSINFWEELPCGIYSLTMAPSQTVAAYLLGEVNKHEWISTTLKELIDWERNLIEPSDEKQIIPQHRSQIVKSNIHAFSSGFAQAVLKSLEESVMRRTSLYRIFLEEEELVPVAVLFSGGLDSMILSALLDQCLDPKYEIDLLNVSFDGQTAPDRISGMAGIKELEKISPLRRWNLVEIDADLSELSKETKHVTTLINPANTYMDLNIGIALWLAARGDGWVNKRTGDHINDDVRRVRYKSNARILLVGAGADEQCAGYGRHRTKFRNGSWVRLHQEMKLDMQRIWKRNLGRDDRCIADNGKEARFPFLDEDVIRTLLDIPLWEIADLDQPSGTGDKKILREVARLLGLHEAATMPKRAIQFGSRIARESNRKNFGSNRAANQAAAGSAVINVASD